MRTVWCVGTGAFEDWDIDAVFESEADAADYIGRHNTLNEARRRRGEYVDHDRDGPWEMVLYGPGERPDDWPDDQAVKAAEAQPETRGCSFVGIDSAHKTVRCSLSFGHDGEHFFDASQTNTRHLIVSGAGGYRWHRVG